MSVTNGQLANQTTFNNAFVSRTAANTSTVSILALSQPASTAIVNAQAFMQEIATSIGLTEGKDGLLEAGDARFYTNERYVVNGDTHNQAIDALDGQLFQTQTDLDTAEDAIIDHEARVATLETNNTLDVTLATFGAVPNTKGASIASQVITLQPANATNPGGISTGAQDIPGAKTFKSNVIIEGDLTVGGTTTTVNATNLEVADKNILVNNGGNDASADGSGIDVERTSDNGALRFDSAMTSKWKLGLASAMYEVLVSGIAQTVSGIKTFSSGINLNSQKIAALLAGVDLTDAVNKSQLDSDGGLLATTTAGTSLTLTDTSVRNHYFTGSANHTVLMPSGVTMVAGKLYKLYNWSTGIIFVQDSTGGALLTLLAGQSAEVRLRVANPTSWYTLPIATFNSGNTYLEAGNKKISNVIDPVGAQDAATKNYVDTISGSVLTTKGDISGFTTVPARKAVGADDKVLTADSTDATGVAYHEQTTMDFAQNYSLNASVAANALTIGLVTAAGNNASSTDPIKFPFRSATLASGVVAIVKQTAALSLTISSGSTLGHANGVLSPVYIYVVNNAGTLLLAASTKYFDDNFLVSTTAEGGAGGADSASLLYASSAVSSKACRFLGMYYISQTTAGTHTALPNSIRVGRDAKSTSEMPVFGEYKATTQAIATATHTGITGFDAVSSTYTTETHPANFNRTTGVYTVGLGEDGLYEVTGVIAWENNATGVRITSIAYNGGLHSYGDMSQAVSAGEGTVTTATVILKCKYTDTINMAGYQTSGGNLNVRALSGASRLMIKRIT